MSLVDELKAALPEWTVTCNETIANADSGGVNVDVWRNGPIVIARAFVAWRKVAESRGDSVESAIAAMRVNLQAIVNDGTAALNALGGGK